MKAKKFSPLLILYQKISQLKPFTRNARTHTKRQIKQIAESIRVFGFVNPVLVDRNNRIVAGHGRVEAAKLLGMDQVPTIRLEDLSEEQIQFYVITDNRLGELAGWNREILAVELQHLLTLDCADFGVEITGFEIAEIDAILEEAKGPIEEDASSSSRFQAQPQSANRATFGSWANTGSCAATLCTTRRTNPDAAPPRLRWSSPTRRTTSGSTDTRLATERFIIVSSPWLRAR